MKNTNKLKTRKSSTRSRPRPSLKENERICARCGQPTTACNCEELFSPLEDVYDPGVQGCAEGNPIVCRNLRRLSARLQDFAAYIEKANEQLDPTCILETGHLLRTYRNTLPAALKDQLEAALDMLPTGSIGNMPEKHTTEQAA